MSATVLWTTAACVAVSVLAAAQEPIRVVRVDSLDRIFPDRPAQAAQYDDPLSVPRGGTVTFQFAISAERGGQCAMSVAGLEGLGGEVTTYEVLAVPVEANTAGGSKTSVTSVPPAAWMEAFVRQAPFEVAEVLIEADAIKLGAGATHAALVEVHVPRDAAPGEYAGAVELRLGDESAKAPFALRVHETAIPPDPTLHVTHWFWPEPENLTNGERPEWWTERHWELLQNSGRKLREFGQNCVLTPLIDYEEPLIRTIRKADGTYEFDYSRFDRWVELFSGLGFEYFNGHHIATLPNNWAYHGVWVWDEGTRKKERLVDSGGANEAWLAFIPIFYDSLYAHLEEKGWTDRYIQHQLDEPKDGELYRKLAALARKHMPKVRTMDAINSDPGAYSPLVDMQVFALTILAKQGELAEQRRAQGQAVWMYHCCSPYPPYPNRHLDERLSDSRLYPWLGYLLGAEGYLNWAANIYRGADPYKTSIGPVPGGSQDPGHPPGDNWFFYPGPDGLRGSMRMIAFRDGLCDHTLLTMLAESDRAKADEVMRSIARSLTDYEKGPAAFRRARKALLTALDGE